ncbi:hypothetical protein Franean1_0501 [Parafrankia sp. EAN1pec]|uniref:hypothetical protein n=1 Tax=Parafrankia sp. (strain EAN1pec) TaxID=298653 RepID=UPI00005433B3|nr:hypothetical protein Franean1_0501 [Frankia sp. EAN1pec]
MGASAPPASPTEFRRPTARNRLVGLLAWLAATIAVAAVTARLAAPDIASTGAAGLTSDIAETTLADRATVVLAQRRIEPVLSLDGRVVPSDPASDGGFDIVAPVRPEDVAYRLIDPPRRIRAAVVGGPSGFDCEYQSLAADSGATEAGATAAAGTSVRCRIPASIRVVPGLSATIGIAWSEPRVTSVLPLTAVLGAAQQGQVVVVDAAGSHTSVRTVALGASDATWIEVSSGLAAGERVLARPVQSDLADD